MFYTVLRSPNTFPLLFRHLAFFVLLPPFDSHFTCADPFVNSVVDTGRRHSSPRYCRRIVCKAYVEIVSDFYIPIFFRFNTGAIILCGIFFSFVFTVFSRFSRIIIACRFSACALQNDSNILSIAGSYFCTCGARLTLNYYTQKRYADIVAVQIIKSHIFFLLIHRRYTVLYEYRHNTIM